MGVTIFSDIPNIEQVLAKVKSTLPVTVANLAKNHFLQGFKKGGGQTNASLGGWAQRKKTSKNPKSRAILVKTNHLRNDIDIRKTTFDEIVIGTNDTDYASYNNEGTPNMPQREFLGDSQKLDVKVDKHIAIKLKKAFK